MKYVACVDIAATSIEQAKDRWRPCDLSTLARYHEMKGRNRGRIYPAEFHAVDCTVSPPPR